ncbi:MAG: hypothetical protein ACPG4T_24925, partial [Nannocystaceae bacterium]
GRDLLAVSDSPGMPRTTDLAWRPKAVTSRSERQPGMPLPRFSLETEGRDLSQRASVGKS